MTIYHTNINMMKKLKLWVLAATLVCGASVLTSCTNDTGDNPVTPDEHIVTLEDALNDGTIVAFTFSVNDEEFYVAFVRVGDIEFLVVHGESKSHYSPVF